MCPSYILPGQQLAPSLHIKHLLTHSTGLDDYLEIDSTDRDDSVLKQFPHRRHVRVGRISHESTWNLLQLLQSEFHDCGTCGGATWRRTLLPRAGPHQRAGSPRNESHAFLTLGGRVRWDYAYGKVTATAEWAPSGRLRTTIPGLVQPDTHGHRCSISPSSQIFIMHGNAAVLGQTQHDAMTSPQISTKELNDIASYGYGLMITDGLGLGSKLVYDSQRVA